MLKAKVLFNAGAAECDDPDGDLMLGIASYQEALKIFANAEETDYQYRTQLRLGKALLLCNDVRNAAEVVEQMKKCPLEERTLMHWHYLQAQVLIKQDRANEALASIHTGINMAKRLTAQADLRRFEILLETAYAHLSVLPMGS